MRRVLNIYRSTVGKKVLMAPNWIQKIEWLEATVLVDLARDTIASSPEFNESMIQPI